MFNINISGNDDDIFDDSKSLLDNEPNESFNRSSKKGRKDDFDKAMGSVLDTLNKILQNKNADLEEARQLVAHLKEVHGFELNNFLAMFRIRLAHTILNGSGSWIEDFQTHVIPRSVVYALDSLCENRFTLVDKFFNLELENAKRIVISRFLTDIFLSHLNNNENALSQIFSAGLDSRYTKMYYEALYDINMFTIWQNNGVYAALGQELDLPCNQDILDCQEVTIDNLTSKNYSENKFSALISPDLKKNIGQSVADYTSRYLENVNKKGN